MKITEYPAVTKINSADVFLLDGTDGTRTIAASDAFLAMMHAISPENVAFAAVGYYSSAKYENANNELGVRPVFAIGA